MSFWNKKIVNIVGDIVGVEINDLSVRVIELGKKGKKKIILNYGSSPLASGNITDGEILNKENIVVALRSAISQAQPTKIKAKKAICSISETKAFLRIINIPKMQKEEISEAIKWELEANIPLTIDQVYYDWQKLDRNFSQEDDKISILVIAVARNIVDQLVGVVEAAGLEVVDVEIESVAQARCLIEDAERIESKNKRKDKDEKEVKNKNENKNETVLIIDLGGRRTSFIVSVGGMPCFTSSIPLSAGSLTDAIAKGLGVSVAEAETAKKNYGIGSAAENNNIFTAVSPILENFAVEIEKSIDFYLNGLGYSTSVDRIIMCGGGANTQGLIAHLARRINREIELGDPWINVDKNSDMEIAKNNEAVQYSTVIGLALKGAYYYENFS